MPAKRLTERFPFLLPLRRFQKKLCFYLKMSLDRNHYARTKEPSPLPYTVFSDASRMINEHSGYDIRYQYNKIHNLNLAAAPIHRVLIRPGETFSFWMLVRGADRKQRYLDGLNLENGRIVGSYGGGLCQLSNLLFWLFLHTPLTLVERHGHRVESFPPAGEELPAGTDATIHEGWLDLKVRNDTDSCYQILLSFTDTDLCGSICCDEPALYRYEIYNGPVRYLRRHGKTLQHAQVRRRRIRLSDEEAWDEILYENQCEIGYPLPEGTAIDEEEDQP